MQSITEFSEEHRPAYEEFQEKSKKDKYATRKELYQPGTLIAIPLLNQNQELDGRYSISLIYGCNWLGDLALYQFKACYEYVPELAEIIDEIVPESIWFWSNTGDPFVVNHCWPVIGNLPEWNIEDWPETIVVSNEKIGNVQRFWYEPRRLEQSERYEIEPKKLPKSWSFRSEGSVYCMESLSLSHDFEDAPWPVPLNSKAYPKAFRKWKEKRTKAKK